MSLPACQSQPQPPPARRSASRLSASARFDNPRKARAVTLIEAMISLFVMALVMLGLLGNFVHSRRVSEGSVLHAAATSLMYGMLEQIKELDYVNLLPNYEEDSSVPEDADGDPLVEPPYIRLRVNQEKVVWLRVVHTPETDEDPDTTIPPPQGPTVTPAPNVSATLAGAFENRIGSIPLSTLTGTRSQDINLDIWVWIDDISNTGIWAAEATAPKPDTADVKKITVVYTYSYVDGNITRTVRDREVIIRSRFDQ